MPWDLDEFCVGSSKSTQSLKSHAPSGLSDLLNLDIYKNKQIFCQFYNHLYQLIGINLVAF